MLPPAVTRPYTHDFRTGRWGHRLHAHTWKVIPATKRTPPRARFMVHTQVPPQPGDFLIFAGVSGLDRKVTVADAEGTLTVSDMYTVTVDMVEVP
jgi:hypothetical protein